jgi:hypothetical protein
MQVTTNQKDKLDENCVVIPTPAGVTGTFTEFGNRVFEWFVDNNIDADLIYNRGSYSAWRIPDEKTRMLFVLRWGSYD